MPEDPPQQAKLVVLFDYLDESFKGVEDDTFQYLADVSIKDMHQISFEIPEKCEDERFERLLDHAFGLFLDDNCLPDLGIGEVVLADVISFREMVGLVFSEMVIEVLVLVAPEHEVLLVLLFKYLHLHLLANGVAGKVGLDGIVGPVRRLRVQLFLFRVFSTSTSISEMTSSSSVKSTSSNRYLRVNSLLTARISAAMKGYLAINIPTYRICSGLPSGLRR